MATAATIRYILGIILPTRNNDSTRSKPPLNTELHAIIRFLLAEGHSATENRQRTASTL